MPLVLPNIDKVANGQLLDGDILAALFQATASKFNKNIVGADVSDTAGINGAGIAANTLPGDRIVNASIAAAQLGLLCVGNANVQDATIQKGKLSTTVGQRVAKAQLELVAFTGAAGWTIGGDYVGFGFFATLGQQVVAGTNSWVIRVYQTCKQVSTGGTVPPTVSGGASNPVASVVAPVVAIPVATTTVLAIVLDTPVFSAGGGSVNATLYYMNNT